jgi:hypothetical protein
VITQRLEVIDDHRSVLDERTVRRLQYRDDPAPDRWYDLFPKKGMRG